MANQKFRNWKNTKFAGIAWLLAILIIVIAVILNMIVSRLDFTADVSPNKQYSLSSITESYLDELDAKGTKVDFYFLAKMEELGAETDSMTLYRALKSYAAHDCINFVDLDPNTDTEMMEKLNPKNDYTLSTGDMLFMCGDNVRRLPGNTMYYSQTDEEGNTAYEEFRGENYITSSIKAVVDGFTPTVYFLSGHGEKGLDKYTKLHTNLSNYNYAAKELLLSETKAVPEDAALVLVAAPTADITEQEMEILDTYLDGGGNISILLSPNGGSFAYTNLESMMREFGFYIDYDRVYETDTQYHVSGDPYTIQCELNQLADDSDAADLTSALLNEGLVTFMPESRSLRYNDDGGRMTIQPLITTYDSAVGEPYGGVLDDPETQEGQLMLAAYSQANDRNLAKMVVFGNAEFIDDDHLSSDTVIVPVYLYLSTISWMYDSDMDMEITSKVSANDYIDLQTKGFAQNLMIVLAVIPVVVLVTGIVIWARRRRS